MAELYVVSTPIGNLEDISLRAKKILAGADLLACEDTRQTGLLLQRLGIKPRPKLISFFEGNENKRLPYLLDLLNQGQKIALVSRAGTPLISDPGFKLVRACIKAKIPVVPVPGACAALAALVASGLPTDHFCYLGFLPKKQAKRLKLLRKYFTIHRYLKATTIIYVSPYRLLLVLADLQTVFGDLEIVIAREMTKLHQEFFYEKISQALTHFTQNKPQGEFTVLF